MYIQREREKVYFLLDITRIRGKRKLFIALQRTRLNIFNHTVTRLYFNTAN